MGKDAQGPPVIDVSFVRTRASHKCPVKILQIQSSGDMRVCKNYLVIIKVDGSEVDRLTKNGDD
jgi:hypothetical protein